MALWEGRFKKELNSKTNDFNSSIRFDSRMYKQDILGSIAHSKMLAKQNIIKEEDMAWQYITTLDWSHINANEIIRFIDLFHDFIRLAY